MKFTKQFYDLAYSTLYLYMPDKYNDFIESLNNKDYIYARYILEESLEDKELFVDRMLDGGDRIIANSKIEAYQNRKILYTMFMNEYIKHLDKINVFDKLRKNIERTKIFVPVYKKEFKI